jgi:hypothetical protein
MFLEAIIIILVIIIILFLLKDNQDSNQMDLDYSDTDYRTNTQFLI